MLVNKKQKIDMVRNRGGARWEGLFVEEFGGGGESGYERER